MQTIQRRTLLAGSAAAFSLLGSRSRAETAPVRVGVLTDMTGL